MENSVQQLRDLLRLAALLRSFAAEAHCAEYAEKLLSAAIELELRADFLAGHRVDPPEGRERGPVPYTPVDIRI